MPHITEKLAEFIFEEMSAKEMADAKQHVSECANCREQVERFQHTLAMLKAAPETEPPRNIVFEFEKPVAKRLWRWFPATAAIAALLVMTIALANRVHVQWNDSQLTIAFGQQIAPPQSDTTAALVSDIQRMQGRLAYLESQQQAIERETMVIATTIQPVARAQRSPAGD
jgi:anti-sigma-K factor RskA